MRKKASDPLWAVRRYAPSCNLHEYRRKPILIQRLTMLRACYLLLISFISKHFHTAIVRLPYNINSNTANNFCTLLEIVSHGFILTVKQNITSRFLVLKGVDKCVCTQCNTSNNIKLKIIKSIFWGHLAFRHMFHLLKNKGL